MSATDLIELTALVGESCKPGEPDAYRDAVTLGRLVRSQSAALDRVSLLAAGERLGMYTDLLALTAAPDLSMTFNARSVIHEDDSALGLADRAGMDYHYCYEGQ